MTKKYLDWNIREYISAYHIKVRDNLDVKIKGFKGPDGVHHVVITIEKDGIKTTKEYDLELAKARVNDIIIHELCDPFIFAYLEKEKEERRKEDEYYDKLFGEA